METISNRWLGIHGQIARVPRHVLDTDFWVTNERI